MPLPQLLSQPVTQVLAAGMLAAMGLTAQVRVDAPVSVAAPAPAAAAAPGAPGQVLDDPGVMVEMFENPNLDRYLRRAQSFLDREDFAAAIQVLQDVVEGKTVEVVAGPDEQPAGVTPVVGAAPVRPAQSPEPVRPRRERGGSDSEPGEAAEPRRVNLPDARNSVFSQDGRFYRPVRRLCHELLARMPSIGIELYRAAYEVAAEEMLQHAIADGATAALEAVANRFFVTMPAGRAMALLADRLMHEGRYRAAVLVLRDLVEIYPSDLRKRLGISEVWCRFKSALCLRLAGEVDAAHASVHELAVAHPEESLRVLGQLESVRDLPASALFARDVIRVASGERGPELSWLAAEVDQLVPLWQVRFRNPEPYKDPKPANNDRNTFFIREGGGGSAMPFAGRYGPATWVTIRPADEAGMPPQAHFLEHYRLRMADAATGVMRAEGDEADEPPPARENHPRVRIAAADFALLRVVQDDARDYVVLGHARATASSPEALKASQLVAYDRSSLQRVWSSAQWFDGEGGLRDVTFLAAPTVFGERLLLPSLRRSAYTLECLDRRTGRPIWNTPLHAGGSPFFKAPGCPVKVVGGIAFVATNAGCVAAVDAFAGDLRWIRRYERADPQRASFRSKRRTNNENPFGYEAPFTQSELPGFLPNDLIVQQGLIVMAPCDGDLLLCLDSASGQVVWFVDATMRYVPFGKLRTLVGIVGEDLFALSDTHLVCIGLSGGLLRWCRELPALGGAKAVSRGRGTVVGDRIVVPGDREVLVFDASDERPMQRLPLPAFDASREPLTGSFNVAAMGAWLAIGYQGGVEMFSSRQGLAQLAARTTTPLHKACYLVHAGDIAAAEAVLVAAMREASVDETTRHRLAGQLLALVHDRAAAMASAGDLEGALRALDVVRELMPDRPTRLAWHLSRVEICRDVGVMRAHEVEQQRLYDYMEGRSSEGRSTDGPLPEGKG